MISDLFFPDFLLHLQRISPTSLFMEYHTYEQGGTYINPLTDAGFKILFARESSQDILIGFLNAVLDRDNVDPITEIQYLDKEKLKE